MVDKAVLDEEFKIKTLAQSDLRAHESSNHKASASADNALVAELNKLNNEDPNFVRQVMTSLHGDTSGGSLPNLTLIDNQINGADQHAVELNISDKDLTLAASSDRPMYSNNGMSVPYDARGSVTEIPSAPADSQSTGSGSATFENEPSNVPNRPSYWTQ